MSTCSAAKIQDTELLGGWHNAIPSENAEAKHEARLLLRVAWKPKRFLNPKTDDSETNLRESETDHGESNNNQTITVHTALRNRYHNLLTVQKWWFGRTCFEPVPRCSQLEKV